MKNVIEYVVIVLLGAYAVKKKFFDSKKTEYETMHKALEVWQTYTEELTGRVNELTQEIHDLRIENQGLRIELKNLESIIKSNQNAN